MSKLLRLHQWNQMSRLLDGSASPPPCCGTESGSYLRLIDSCITQRKAHGPSRTCNESKEEEEAAPMEPNVSPPRRVSPPIPIEGLNSPLNPSTLILSLVTNHMSLLMRGSGSVHESMESNISPPRRVRFPTLFFCFTLVTGSRRSLSLKLSDTRVYEPQIRARLGTSGTKCLASSTGQLPRPPKTSAKTVATLNAVWCYGKGGTRNFLLLYYSQA